MSAAEDNPPEQRVLVLAPAEEDAGTLRRILAEAEVDAEFIERRGAAALRTAWRGGVAAVVVADDALTPAVRDALGAAFGEEPPWSDLPVVVLGSPEWAAQEVPPHCRWHEGPNYTFVQRPLQEVPLKAAICTALRARRHQHELRRLLNEADRAVRQRDEFLAMLGHELRNPLSVISSAVQILNRIGSPQKEAAETRDMVERQASHLTRIVDDLLDVARVSSGKIVLQSEPVELNEVVRQCVHTCDGAASAQRHEVTFAPSPEPAVVDGDLVRLEQVVNNLLTNAIKYTPAGGRIDVAVTLETRPGGEAGREAVVRVRDSGVGIEGDMLDRVFDMFTQADRSIDRAQGGVGMGLTLVRRLVQMHAGSVSARSAGRGTGSEFEVRLPASAKPPAALAAGSGGGAKARTAPAKPRAVMPRHVLIVEDGPDARAALGRLLELWGHRVELAEDGTRGVERAIASHPEIALVDIGLPGLNGYEVARRVRQVLGDKIRLIALTGYGQPDDQQRTREAGFDQHLVKPVNPRLLARMLAEPEPTAGR